MDGGGAPLSRIHEPMTPRVSVLVADDEPLARQALVDIITAVPGWEVVAEVGDGREACDRLRHHTIDVAFLDIEMPAPNGIEVARWALAEAIDLAVVFVTSHNEHAVRAFDVQALDYVLKPLRPSRVQESMRRALEQRSNARLRQAIAALEPVSATPTRWIQYLTATTNGTSRVIAVHEVLAFTAEDNYVRIHLKGGSTLIRGTLGALLERLDPRTFIRTHRGAVVNGDAVLGYRTTTNGEYVAKLRAGVSMPVSRRYRDAFLARFR